jgi:hypothetical protein
MIPRLCGCTRSLSREGQTQKREAIQARLDEPFAFRFGQTARIEGEKIEIEFADVTEDSRCPVNVTCVWEGQVTIALDISIGGKQPAYYHLTRRAVHEELASANIDGYSMTLLKVKPPKTKDKIELAEYIVTLSVSKTQ